MCGRPTMCHLSRRSFWCQISGQGASTCCLTLLLSTVAIIYDCHMHVHLGYPPTLYILDCLRFIGHCTIRLQLRVVSNSVQFNSIQFYIHVPGLARWQLPKSTELILPKQQQVSRQVTKPQNWASLGRPLWAWLNCLLPSNWFTWVGYCAKSLGNRLSTAVVGVPMHVDELIDACRCLSLSKLLAILDPGHLCCVFLRQVLLCSITIDQIIIKVQSSPSGLIVLKSQIHGIKTKAAEDTKAIATCLEGLEGLWSSWRS